MEFNLLHVLVFDKSEISKDDILITDFYDLSFGDYIDHMLIDKDRKKIIYDDDNIHSPIEEQINSFIKGLCYSGAKVNLEVGILYTEKYHCIETAEFIKKIT